MERWHRKELIQIFLQLQKKDKLYWFLEILSITVMTFAVCLFLFFLRLYQGFMGTQRYGDELGSILSFSQKGLHILIAGCLFIGILTLQSLCYFRSVKDQKRSAVLRVLGLGGKWIVLFDMMEAFVVVTASFFPAYWGGRAAFFATVKKIVEKEARVIVQDGETNFRLLLVPAAMFVLLLVSYRISRRSEAHKTMAEQLRGTEHRKKKDEKDAGKRLFLFFAGTYLVILFTVADQIVTTLMGTVVLLLLGLCDYILSGVVLRVTERLVSRSRNKRTQKKEFWRIVLQTGGVREKSVFLSTVVATGLLLFYFLLSINGGMEGLLERSWIQSRQTNMYMESDFDDEAEIEDWLNENEISYQKLYVKELQQEDMMLAVSRCEDKDSPYYVQEGYIKTIPYNLYRWGVEEGDQYRFFAKRFTVDKPMHEEGFQLIGYTCLVNYEDWKENLDISYVTAFAIYADRKQLGMIESWAQEHGREIMTVSRYMEMIKEVYAPYLRILEVILAILSVSILIFLFVSILSNIITRQREFFVYRGCGVGWRKIGKIILIQFSYTAISASLVSALMFGIAFNGIKLLWLRNTTAYVVGIRQLFIVALPVFAFIGAESSIAMKYVQKRSGTVIEQLRAD